jgi:flagellin
MSTRDLIAASKHGQSRLSFAVNTVFSMRDTYLAAESRIKDVDAAEEASRNLAAGIRQRIAVALLAQGNQDGGLAVRLLS